MLSNSSFCKLGLAIALGIGFVPTTIPAQTLQGERRMPDMRLPGVTFPAGKSFVEIPFEIEGNWMVIPVSVNGSRPLSFVLDSGASGTMLYNSGAADSLNLIITGTMSVRGAGGSGATSEVSIAENVGFNIGGIEFSRGRLAIRKSPSALPLLAGRDGVIGRIVFATLVVEVDWEKRTVRFHDTAKFEYSGKGAVLPLTFDEGGRPYAMAAVSVSGDEKVPVKLVVDTGGSHTLSLDVGSKPEILLPEGARKTVLGRGGSGEITGHVGRIKSVEFGGQTLNDVPTNFPDDSSGTAGIGGRQGNLGSGILRRFKVVYDYARSRMIVEPNKFVGEPFGTAMPNRVATSTAQVSPSALQDYVGTYGNKQISVRDGGLYYQRVDGRGAALAATGQDKFAFNIDAYITFLRDGKGVVSEMLIEWVERDRERLKRESPTTTNQPTIQPRNEQALTQAEREGRKLERELPERRQAK